MLDPKLTNFKSIPGFAGIVMLHLLPKSNT